MLSELGRCRGRHFRGRGADVDADPAARVRYAHKIPVLLIAGEWVCHGHLDAEEGTETLAWQRRPV